MDRKGSLFRHAEFRPAKIFGIFLIRIIFNKNFPTWPDYSHKKPIDPL
jgi:hypothetical protein